MTAVNVGDAGLQSPLPNRADQSLDAAGRCAQGLFSQGHGNQPRPPFATFNMAVSRGADYDNVWLFDQCRLITPQGIPSL